MAQQKYCVFNIKELGVIFSSSLQISPFLLSFYFYICLYVE